MLLVVVAVCLRVLFLSGVHILETFSLYFSEKSPEVDGILSLREIVLIASLGVTCVMRLLAIPAALYAKAVQYRAFKCVVVRVPTVATLGS